MVHTVTHREARIPALYTREARIPALYTREARMGPLYLSGRLEWALFTSQGG